MFIPDLTSMCFIILLASSVCYIKCSSQSPLLYVLLLLLASDTINIHLNPYVYLYQ